MIHRTYTPGPPLRYFIDRFWLCSDSPPHRRERILPSGTIAMVFNLRDDEIRIYDPCRPECYTRFSGAVASGAYSRFFVIDPVQHASIFGVHFRPGGAFPFLGVPIGELTNRHLDLETFFGPSAAELRERLCAAGRYAERFSLLEEALVSRLRQTPRSHGAVAAALDMFEQPIGERGVREVARQVGLSHRRFIQVFATEVGLTPKLYCRVRRFQQACERVGKAAVPDWAGVAVDCGYFDQSHLIRDFRTFTGFSPQAYLQQRSERVLPNHVPQAD